MAKLIKPKAAERSRRAKLHARGIIDHPQIDLSFLNPQKRAQLNQDCMRKYYEANQECCIERVKRSYLHRKSTQLVSAF